MVFADPDHPAVHQIHSPVRVAQTSWPRRGFSDWNRRRVAFLAVQALVGIVAEIDDAISDQIRAAAIFMDPAADIERRWTALRHWRCDIGLAAIRRAADDDRPSLPL